MLINTVVELIFRYRLNYYIYIYIEKLVTFPPFYNTPFLTRVWRKRYLPPTVLFPYGTNDTAST